MKYSAISDCGSSEQMVSSPSCESGPDRVDLGDRPLLGVDEEVLDDALVDAGDLDLGAVDDPEGVVHFDEVGVGVVAARRRREAGAAEGQD